MGTTRKPCWEWDYKQTNNTGTIRGCGFRIWVNKQGPTFQLRGERWRPEMLQFSYANSETITEAIDSMAKMFDSFNRGGTQ